MSDMSLSEYNERQAEIDDLREALVRSNQALRAANKRKEALVQAVFEGAKDAMIAMGPVKPVPPPPKDKRAGKTEAALWHLTDWQLAKTTPSYNSQVAEERVKKFIQKAHRITHIQRADHPVNHCIIAFGGDMQEGLFNFPTQPYEIDKTIYEQFVTTARLEVEVVRYALTVYDTVEVIAEPGNHGRIGNKSSVIPKSDNLDRMTYEMARQQLLEEPRLKWSPDHGKEDIQRLEYGNYRALVIHGDEIGRQGFASPTTILAHCNRWKAGAYGWDFRDVYVGHFHNHMELSMADGLGSVYWTGSTESENHYARDTMAASATPSQRLHFIDPEKGMVTAQYRILLD